MHMILCYLLHTGVRNHCSINDDHWVTSSNIWEEGGLCMTAISREFQYITVPLAITHAGIFLEVRARGGKSGFPKIQGGYG